MPSNFTENYSLSQWERTDQVRMEDFNADNAKIDAALKAEADARTAADSAINALLAKCGNCLMWTMSYQGTNTFGEDHPMRYTFPWKPDLILITKDQYTTVDVLTPATTAFNFMLGGGSERAKVSWSGNTMTIVAPYFNGQFNDASIHYRVFAFAVKN